VAVASKFAKADLLCDCRSTFLHLIYIGGLTMCKKIEQAVGVEDNQAISLSVEPERIRRINIEEGLTADEMTWLESFCAFTLTEGYHMPIPA